MASPASKKTKKGYRCSTCHVDVGESEAADHRRSRAHRSAKRRHRREKERSRNERLKKSKEDEGIPQDDLYSVDDMGNLYCRACRVIVRDRSHAEKEAHLGAKEFYLCDGKKFPGIKYNEEGRGFACCWCEIIPFSGATLVRHFNSERHRRAMEAATTSHARPSTKDDDASSHTRRREDPPSPSPPLLQHSNPPPVDSSSQPQPSSSASLPQLTASQPSISIPEHCEQLANNRWKCHLCAKTLIGPSPAVTHVTTDSLHQSLVMTSKILENQQEFYLSQYSRMSSRMVGVGPSRQSREPPLLWASEVARPKSDVHYVQARMLSLSLETARFRLVRLEMRNTTSSRATPAVFHLEPRVALQHVSSGLYVTASYTPQGLLWLHASTSKASFVRLIPHRTLPHACYVVLMEPCKRTRVPLRLVCLYEGGKRDREEGDEDLGVCAADRRSLVLFEISGLNEVHKLNTANILFYFKPVEETTNEDVAFMTMPAKRQQKNVDERSNTKKRARDEDGEGNESGDESDDGSDTASSSSSSNNTRRSSDSVKNDKDSEEGKLESSSSSTEHSSVDDNNQNETCNDAVEVEEEEEDLSSADEAFLNAAAKAGHSFELFMRRRPLVTFLQDKCVCKALRSGGNYHQRVFVCGAAGTQPFTVIGFGDYDSVVKAIRNGRSIADSPERVNCQLSLLRGGVPGTASSCLIPVVLTTRAVRPGEKFLVDGANWADSVGMSDYEAYIRRYCRPIVSSETTILPQPDQAAIASVAVNEEVDIKKEGEAVAMKEFEITHEEHTPLRDKEEEAAKTETEETTSDVGVVSTVFQEVRKYMCKLLMDVEETEADEEQLKQEQQHKDDDKEAEDKELKGPSDQMYVVIKTNEEGGPSHPDVAVPPVALSSSSSSSLMFPPATIRLIDAGGPSLQWDPYASYYYGNHDALSVVTEEALLEFPYSLLEVRPCLKLRGELEVVAKYFVPRGTCFMYCGPQLKDDDIISPTAAQKKLGKDKHKTTTHGDAEHEQRVEMMFSAQATAMNIGGQRRIEGGNVLKYVNHYFGFASEGNVSFRRGAVLYRHQRSRASGAPTTQSSSSSSHYVGAKKRRGGSSTIAIREAHVVFFVATKDIQAGELLLAESYGSEYDSVIERLAMCRGKYLSSEERNELVRAERQQQSRILPDGYVGCYLNDVTVGALVGRRRGGLLHDGSPFSTTAKSKKKRKASEQRDASSSSAVMDFYVVTAVTEDNVIVGELLEFKYPTLRRKHTHEDENEDEDEDEDAGHFILRKTEVILFVPGWDYDTEKNGGATLLIPEEALHRVGFDDLLFA